MASPVSDYFNGIRSFTVFLLRRSRRFIW